MEKTVLVKYLLSFFHATVPVANHSYYEKPELTEARYESIADTIADASIEAPLFDDDTDGVKTALVLSSIATYESHLRADIDSCKLGGDKVNGNFTAWTLWQMHQSKSKVCASRLEGARAAREMVRDSFKACKSSDVMDRLSLYTDGVCKSNWQRSRSRMYRAMNFGKTHPIEATE